MVLRQLVIECPPVRGKKLSSRVQVNVDDRAAIGPWMMTLVARLGYPLVDSFGSPITYRLRSISNGETIQPTVGRFADVRFSLGSQFILEQDIYRTTPIQKYVREGDLQEHTLISSIRFSRRSLLSAGILTTFSLLGFGSGMTTAFAQRLLAQRKVAPTPFSVHTIFSQHRQTVRTVTWAPDGNMIASGADDGIAFVWKLDTIVLHQLQFNAPVRALAWSFDNTQLVAGAANIVSFFDPHTGVLLAENAGQHTAPVTSLGWTNAQQSAPLAISAGIDKRAIVWSEQSHQPLVVFRQHTSAIDAIAVLANTVVTVSEGGLARAWSAFNGQEVHGYYSDSQLPLRAAAFSSRGNLAVGSDDGSIYLWNDGRTCTHQMQDAFGVHCVDSVVHLRRHSSPIRAIAFSPDGTHLATGGDDKNLIIWSMKTLTPLLIQPQQDVPAALSWSPSGQLLAGALGTHIVIWQIQL